MSAKTNNSITFTKETAIALLKNAANAGQKTGCLNIFEAGGPVLKAIQYFENEEKDKPSFGSSNDEIAAINILIQVVHKVQASSNNPLSFKDAGVLVDAINFLQEHFKNTGETSLSTEPQTSSSKDKKGKKPMTSIEEIDDNDDDDALNLVNINKKM